MPSNWKEEFIFIRDINKSLSNGLSNETAFSNMKKRKSVNKYLYISYIAKIAYINLHTFHTLVLDIILTVL